MNTRNQRTDQSRDTEMERPKAGDRFRCAGCGMELQVTADCRCPEGEHVHFQCCGREMARA